MGKQRRGKTLGLNARTRRQSKATDRTPPDDVIRYPAHHLPRWYAGPSRRLAPPEELAGMVDGVDVLTTQSVPSQQPAARGRHSYYGTAPMQATRSLTSLTVSSLAEAHIAKACRCSVCEATLKAACEAGCRFERLLNFKLKAKESMEESGGIYTPRGHPAIFAGCP